MGRVLIISLLIALQTGTAIYFAYELIATVVSIEVVDVQQQAN